MENVIKKDEKKFQEENFLSVKFLEEKNPKIRLNNFIYHYC